MKPLKAFDSADHEDLPAKRRGPRRVWSEQELQVLREHYSKESISALLKLFPERKWTTIQQKALAIGLHRPPLAPLGSTLNSDGDIGFCAGMIIADGCVVEACVSSGNKRSKFEGATTRPRRYYSIPQVRITMEDRESLERIGKLWGRRVSRSGTSSVGNAVWSVQLGGKKANELLWLILPYLSGPKKIRAQYLLQKYAGRTSLPVERKDLFKPFGGNV